MRQESRPGWAGSSASGMLTWYVDQGFSLLWKLAGGRIHLQAPVILVGFHKGFLDWRPQFLAGHWSEILLGLLYGTVMEAASFLLCRILWVKVRGCPGGPAAKTPCCQCLGPLFDPWSGNYGEGSGTPLQYSCLENPVDGGAWWAAVHGVTQSRTLLMWLSSRELDPTRHN